jgi:hypothetical protein
MSCIEARASSSIVPRRPIVSARYRWALSGRSICCRISANSRSKCILRKTVENEQSFRECGINVGISSGRLSEQGLDVAPTALTMMESLWRG